MGKPGPPSAWDRLAWSAIGIALAWVLPALALRRLEIDGDWALRYVAILLVSACGMTAIIAIAHVQPTRRPTLRVAFIALSVPAMLPMLAPAAGTIHDPAARVIVLLTGMVWALTYYLSRAGESPAD